MENFIVSARKYRPSTFDMVVGQESITNTLKNAIRNNYLAQSYLFCGPRGVGKTTCARIYAKTINCFNIGENVEPCNECESCVSFNSLRSLNIHELDAASNNKVEDIRSLTDQVRIPPQTGRYSIYIIDEVHMLSSSAFNAFLKTLEEPPPHAIFILATTEKHKIIPTILSRCQIFDFNRIRTEDIVRRLKYVAEEESVEYDEQALHIIAVKADGALRDALSIFDQIVSYSSGRVVYEDVIANLNLLDHEYYFKITDALLMGRYGDTLLLLDEILENGFDGHNFINGLGTHFRNLLVSADQHTLKLLDMAGSVRERYREQSLRCSALFLFRALEICSNCDISYKTSKNQRLLIEIALCKLSEIIRVGDGEEVEKKKSQTVKPAIDDAKEDKSLQKSEIISKDIPIKRATSTLSVRSIMKNDAGDAELPPVKESHLTDNESEVKTDASPVAIDQEKMIALWQEFSSVIEDISKRIAVQVLDIKPYYSDEGKVLFSFKNLSLKEEFDDKVKNRFVRFIEERTGGLVVLVETAIENPADISGEVNYYTDDQKFDYLAEKNSPVKDLKRLFNLDFE